MTETDEAKRLRIHQLWQTKLGENVWNGWKALLAGWNIEGVACPVDPNTPFQGYYRSKNPDKTFEPVHFFLDDGKWACLRPRRPDRYKLVIQGDADWDRVVDQWKYISRYPISHTWYKSASETGIWPDADARTSSDALANSAAPAEAKIGGNNPPPDTPAEKTEPEPTTPSGILKNKIANAKLGMADYAKITSDEQMAKAKSLKNLLTELAGEAKGHRETLSRPHLDDLATIRGEWSPIVDDAEASARTLNAAYNAWETEKLRLARVEEQRVLNETTERERIIQANAKAAIDAEAKGEPVDTTKLEHVPEVKAATTTVTTETKVTAGYGRAGSRQFETVVIEVDDPDALYAFLSKPKMHSELRAKMLELAQRAVKAGLEPPGIKTEEQVKVKG